MTSAPRLLAATSLAALAAGTAFGTAAAAPRVVADIPPVHSIVARVMEGAGTPELILPPGASPHGYALRPSEAEMLESADLVVWIGEALTPWLDGALDALAGDATHLALVEAEGMRLLPVREGGPFEAHDHDHAVAEDHDDDDHDHDHDHAHDHDDDHAHDHDDDHDHDHAHHHDDDHDHAADTADGHLWLDPMNALAAAEAIAAALGEADEENAELYNDNAAAFAGEMAALVDEIEGTIEAVQGISFIVFHDAYQYFEDRFGIPAEGSLALHDADQPSAARLAEIQARVRGANVVCVFSEPQFEPRLLDTAIEGSTARTGVLDPLGAGLEPGPALYPALIRGLAGDLAGCLGEES
ncbi:zinc ABC transporter substrate-binding protein ZnuA [soil metagenome]